MIEILLIAQLFINQFAVGGVVPITPANLEQVVDIQATGTVTGVAESTTVPPTVLAALENSLRAYQLTQRSA